jgi:hypothetical protein
LQQIGEKTRTRKKCTQSAYLIPTIPLKSSSMERRMYE